MIQLKSQRLLCALLVGVGACLFAQTASAQPVTFGSATNFDTGLTPVQMALADFNSDGTPDLAVVNSGTNSISILLGNGTGGFAAGPNSPFAVGASPRGIVAADLNSDTVPDLAVTNQASSTVSVLLADGAGGFGVPMDFLVPEDGVPFAIAAGDFNFDFIPDLAVVNQTADNVGIFLGDGTGLFAPADGSPFATGSAPTGIAVSDFNGDLALDLAVTSANDSNVTILLGNGFGSFSPTPGSPFAIEGVAPAGIVANDFNGDGFVDLATANADSNSVSVLLGAGNGSFAPAAASPFGARSAPAGIVAGDFNGDGNVDLTVTNSESSNFSVLRGNGSGGFSPYSNFVVGAGPTAVAAGDFNADGKLDVAVVNQTDNNVSVRLNTTCCFITVTNVGAVSGNVVTSSPARIDCGVNCFRAFAPGMPMTLTATPASGFEFAGWSGACTGTSTCDLAPITDLSVVATFSVLINPPALPDGAAGAPYEQILTPAAGTPPFTFSLQSGTLPPNFTLSGDGVVSGTSPVLGIFNFTVRVTNEDGLDGTRPYSLTIGCPVITLSATAFPGGAIGSTYPPTMLTQTGGVGAVMFSLTGGALPNGMSLSSAGTVSGTPTATGTFNFTATATDANGCTGSNGYSLTISPNTPPTISVIGTATTGRNTPVTVSFTVADAETGAALVTVSGTSTNQTLVPNANLIFGGSGANRTLTITPVNSQIGSTMITVTASDGGLSSGSSFTLNVPANTEPRINGPGNVITGRNTPITLSFTVADSETAPSALMVTATSSNQTVVPNANVVMMGSDGDRTVTLTPAAGQWGATTIAIAVSDGTFTTHFSFVLVVYLGVVADLNHDAKADLLWRHRTTGEDMGFLMSGTTVAESAFLATVSDTNWEIRGNGDFNGDGMADVTWRHRVTGQNVGWLMNGLTVATAASLPTIADTNWEISRRPRRQRRRESGRDPPPPRHRAERRVADGRALDRICGIPADDGRHQLGDQRAGRRRC